MHPLCPIRYTYLSKFPRLHPPTLLCVLQNKSSSCVCKFSRPSRISQIMLFCPSSVQATTGCQSTLLCFIYSCPITQQVPSKSPQDLRSCWHLSAPGAHLPFFLALPATGSQSKRRYCSSRMWLLRLHLLLILPSFLCSSSSSKQNICPPGKECMSARFCPSEQVGTLDPQLVCVDPGFHRYCCSPQIREFPVEPGTRGTTRKS